MRELVSIVLLEENSEIRLRNWVEAAEGVAELARHHVSSHVHLVKSARQRETLARSLSQNPPLLVVVLIDREQQLAAERFLSFFAELERPLVVLAGTLASLGAHLFQKIAGPKAIIIGDWQVPLASLAQKFLSEGDGSDIPGVRWRGSRGWQSAPLRRVAHDLSSLAAPDYSALPLLDMFKIRGPVVPLLASRGCPYNCAFCHEPSIRMLQAHESDYRVRTAQQVVAMAGELKAAYGVRRFVFVDEIFPWQIAWVREFSSAWEERVGLPFEWTATVENSTEDILRLLAKAGGDCLHLGVETGDDHRRSAIADRNLVNRELRSLVQSARERHKLKVAFHYMVGTPGETRQTLEASIALAENLKPDRVEVQSFVLWPRDPHAEHSSDSGMELTGIVIREARSRQQRAAEEGEQVSSADVTWAANSLQGLDAMQRSAGAARRTGATLDGVADFGKGKCHSHLAAAARIMEFPTPEGPEEVLALRVPAEFHWSVNLPADPVLSFGILLKPEFPGLRTRQPISFSVKLEQDGKTYRLFQKVLIQALDPDSRDWHWFRLPLRPSHPGQARLYLESVVIEKGSAYLPPDEDLWAGWGRVLLTQKGENDTSEEG